MDKIAELLEKLENKVTPTIAKRLDGLNNLETRLAVAKKDLDASPDDEELKESHQEIVDYIEDYKEDLIEDLESLIEAKAKAKAKEEKPKVEEKPKGEEKPKEVEPKEEKESSTNIAGWIFGGLLLVGSLGAINYFRNNR
jgi:hypothetical protein